MNLNAAQRNYVKMVRKQLQYIYRNIESIVNLAVR